MRVATLAARVIDWLAIATFMGLAAVAFAVYAFSLGHVDAIAGRRREILATELCK